ncbi:MMPL family transporter [Calditerrivibrio sp.]|uniref:MMPL family transporter n=1 Tax=Calditerrivibrio sp. TaxID=2792612 RepID=UPI003D0A6D5A
MKKLLIFAKNNYIAVLIVIFIITLLFASQIPKVVIDPSSDGFMIKGDPEKTYYEKIIKEFGSDNRMIIFLKDKNLFSEDKINAISKVLEKLEKYKYISKIETVYNQKNIKWRDGGLITEDFLDPFNLPSKEEILQAKRDAIENPILNSNLINKDGTAMAINIIIEKHPEIKSYDTIVSKEIESYLKPLNGVIEEYFQIGGPYFKKSLVEYIIKDQIKLVPLAVLVLFIVVIISLRSLYGALSPLVTAGLSVVWTFGFMGLIGIPINIITVIIPALVIVIGSTEDIHMISEYFEGLEHKQDRHFAIEFMANKMGIAIFLTAFTTIAGFSSIITNDITVLKQFGIVTTFGLIANFIITVFYTPAMLRLRGPLEAPTHSDRSDSNIFQKIANLALKIIYFNRGFVFGVVVVITVAIGFGMNFLRINNDTISYFKKTSEIRLRSDIVKEHLAGAQNFYIVVDAGKPGAFKNPHYLKEIYKIVNHLNETKYFSKSIGISDFIALVNQEMNEGNKKFYVIPESKELIAQYYLLFHRKDIENNVNADFSKANIIVKHNLTSSYELKNAIQEVQNYIKNNVDSSLKIKFTGENVLVNAAADTIAIGQPWSITLILFIIFFIMSILFLNLKAGLLSLIPNIIPIFFAFGTMGYLGIDLNVGTAMIAAISIGIAVDDTIHLMVRYNSELKRMNDQDLAIQETMHSEVRAVVSTSIALTLGFSVLVLSNFLPVIHFGWLSAMVMVIALLADLIITPLLLSKTRLITLWDMLNIKLKQSVFNSVLFEGMKKWQIKKLVLSSKMKEFKEGEYIIRQGDKERTFYLLLDGKADVFRNIENGESIKITTFEDGQFFGEIALCGDIERTANVIAKTNCLTLEFDWESLERIRKFLPNITAKFFMNLSKVMSIRLKETTEKITKGV